MRAILCLLMNGWITHFALITIQKHSFSNTVYLVHFQSCRMPNQIYRLSFLSLLEPLLSVLVLNLLLTHSCRGKIIEPTMKCKECSYSINLIKIIANGSVKHWSASCNINRELNLAINNNEWSSGIIINDDDKIQFSLNHLRAPPLKEGKEPIYQLSPTQKY